jgi:hypothetical protein
MGECNTVPHRRNNKSPRIGKYSGHPNAKLGNPPHLVVEHHTSTIILSWQCLRVWLAGLPRAKAPYRPSDFRSGPQAGCIESRPPGTAGSQPVSLLHLGTGGLTEALAKRRIFEQTRDGCGKCGG